LALVTVLIPVFDLAIPGAPSLKFIEGASQISVIFSKLVDYGIYPFVFLFKYLSVLMSPILNFEFDHSFSSETKVYMRLITSLWIIMSYAIVVSYWRRWWSDYNCRLIFYCSLVAPFFILFFDFNKVRYIYFVQFFLNYILAFIISKYFIAKGICNGIPR